MRKSSHLTPAVSGGVKYPMSKINRKLRKLVWAERLRTIRVLAIPVVIVAILASAIYYFNEGDWVSSEIEVTMKSIAVQEDDTRILYRALVMKDDGTVFHVTMPQSSHFKAGAKAKIMESVNLDSGKKRYRFLYPIAGT